jgi:hypothetical protein
MAKVSTLSRLFLNGHPKEGKPTFFVEKFLKNIGIDYSKDEYLQQLLDLNKDKITSGKLSFEDIETFWISLQDVEDSKGHTIRSGNHFKPGDKISIRCWFGRPYHGCQIILAPDITVEKIYGFCIENTQMRIISKDSTGNTVNFPLNMFSLNIFSKKIRFLCKNDGLLLSDFLAWFNYPKPFFGQIICWDSKINYC